MSTKHHHRTETTTVTHTQAPDVDDEMDDNVVPSSQKRSRNDDEDETTDGNGGGADQNGDDDDDGAPGSGEENDEDIGDDNAPSQKRHVVPPTPRKGKGNGGAGKRVMPHTLFDTRDSENEQGAAHKKEYLRRRAKMVGTRLLSLQSKRSPMWKGVRKYRGLKQSLGLQMQTSLTSLIATAQMHQLMDAINVSGYVPVLIKGRTNSKTGKSQIRYSLQWHKAGKKKLDGISGLPKTLNAGHVLRAAQSDPYTRPYAGNLVSSEGWLASGKDYNAPSKNDCIAQITLYKENSEKASAAAKKVAKKTKGK
jgi:hypothetical protein